MTLLVVVNGEWSLSDSVAVWGSPSRRAVGLQRFWAVRA